MRLFVPDNFLVERVAAGTRLVRVGPKLVGDAGAESDVETLQRNVVKHVSQIARQSTQLVLGHMRQNLSSLQVKRTTKERKQERKKLA